MRLEKLTLLKYFVRFSLKVLGREQVVVYQRTWGQCSLRRVTFRGILLTNGMNSRLTKRCYSRFFVTPQASESVYGDYSYRSTLREGKVDQETLQIEI